LPSSTNTEEGPNPRLQRTPSAPLSCQPLGHRMSLGGGKGWRPAGAFAVVLALVACSSHRGGYASEAEAIAHCTQSGDCSDLILKPGVVLTPSEECWVQKLRARCDVSDRCILKCLLDGEARNVGGGCWHVCGYIFVGVNGEPFLCPGSPVPGWQECENLRPAS
jgi:hypothetical protein